MRNRTRQRGFSLIELLIVVAIILIIAAIAIPNLIRSRIAANEASAVSAVKTINTAQITYAATYPHLGFADDLAKLGGSPGAPAGPNSADILDWVLGCASQPCPKSGYLFAIVNPVGTPVVNFQVTAVPAMVGQSGNRGFCADQLSTITVDPAGGTNCTILFQ
jgi:type IV pilus assembly protein PilA